MVHCTDGACNGQRNVIRSRAILSKAIQDLFKPRDLALRPANMLLEVLRDFGIVLDALDLRLHDRYRLVFHRMGVAKARDEEGSGFTVVRHVELLVGTCCSQRDHISQGRRFHDGAAQIHVPRSGRLIINQKIASTAAKAGNPKANQRQKSS